MGVEGSEIPDEYGHLFADEWETVSPLKPCKSHRVGT